MKILVTGGAGFIGSHIVERYHKENHEVHVIDNFSTGKRENIDFLPNEYIYNFEVQNRKLFSKLLEKEDYDIVIHLAAVVSVVETIENPLYSQSVNNNATLNILESIRQHTGNLKKFIFASSAAVYGNDPVLPKTIKSSINPESPYAIQKFFSEQYGVIYNKLYDIPTTSLRFFNVYGPRQNPESAYSGVISIMNKCFSEDDAFTFYGDGNQTRDFVYIMDLVDAIDIVINNSKTNGKVYNLGTGNSTSLLDIYNEFRRVYGRDIKYSFKPERPGDIRESYADISELKALGYSPRYSINEGLEEYIYSEKKESY